jgi:asparaginyl-tRNA synthetase
MAEDGLRPEWATPALHLRNPQTRLALRIQHRIQDVIRAELTRMGFVEFLAPIVGPVTDPGIRGAKQGVIDYYGRDYRVMSSGILYKQLALQAFDKIFFNAPNLRMEPPETAGTGRHLAEFYQIDIEIARATYDGAMDVAEQITAAATSAIAKEFGSELKEHGRILLPLKQPFPRLTHAECVKKLHDLGREQDPKAEIRWPEEEFLSAKSDTAFFIKDYPKGSRGFYDQEDPQRPGILRDFDLILPEGYGEVVSGAEREYRYERVIARMRETGENPAKYGWYVEMLKSGIPPSSGFGIGVERLTRFLTGLDAVWKTRPWPKVPGYACP